MSTRQIDPGLDPYTSKLGKLIPAEVSAAYLAINSIVPLPQGYSWTILLSIVFLTIACALYLRVLQGVTSYLQIGFTTAAFPLWAANISTARSDALDPTTLGVILILITLFIPLLPTR